MQPIGMPAWKLTADCIWNSFRSSGKKHLLLTGSPGSGKTTLLAKLTGKTLPGITTWAVPGEAVFLQENGTNNRVRIGIFNLNLPGTERKMQPVIFGFAALGVPALVRCREAEGEWCSMDEIGYLELECPEYCRELLRLLDKKRLIGAVRKQQLPFLQSLIRREDAFVVDLDQPFGNMGCVIMASGLGRRFGGSKLLAPFLGRPMLSWVLDATEGIFARRVVVTRSAEAAEYVQHRGGEALLHEEPYRSDTVRLGLEAVGDVSHCLFCPADQPLLTASTVMSLVLCGLAQPDAIWRPTCQDQPSAPILFPDWTFPELRSLPQGKGGGYIANAYPDKVRFLPVADGLELTDIDTPENLSQLERDASAH